MKYKPVHFYELRPAYGILNPSPSLVGQPEVTTKSKTDRLRELKKMADEKLITEAEYEREKQKILDEP